MNRYRREEMGGLALVRRIRAKAGRRNELLQLLEEANALGAEHEPEGALSSTFHLSPVNPDLIVVYLHFPSRASLDEHAANYERIPAYGEMLLRLDDLRAVPDEVVEAMTPVVRFTRADTVAREEPVPQTRYRKKATDGVAFLARFVAREGKGEQLLMLFDEAAALQAEHEPEGALTAVLHTSRANADIVVAYEHYPSQASLDGHQAKLAGYAPYQDLRRRLGELLAKPPEIVEQATPIVRFSREARNTP